MNISIFLQNNIHETQWHYTNVYFCFSPSYIKWKFEYYVRWAKPYGRTEVTTKKKRKIIKRKARGYSKIVLYFCVGLTVKHYIRCISFVIMLWWEHEQSAFFFLLAVISSVCVCLFGEKERNLQKKNFLPIKSLNVPLIRWCLKYIYIIFLSIGEKSCPQYEWKRFFFAFVYNI